MTKQSVGPTGIEIVWPGKYDSKGIRSKIEVYPSQRMGEEWFGTGENSLCCGDNLLVLQDLLYHVKESVDLVYIDPPFNTGTNFSAKLRRGKGDSPTEIIVPAYEDAWEGGATGFLQMLDSRLRLIYEILAPSGSLYVHVDPTMGHAVKILLDEIFGAHCFQREIVWRIGWLSGFKTQAKNWIRNHDLIYFYVKNPQEFTFNKEFVPYPSGYLRRDGKPPKGRGIPIEDVWNANASEFSMSGKDSLDSIQIKSFSREKTGWATQKNESLLARIIRASSNPGDLVADFFCGSGTTAVVASKLGRRWIASDISPVAVNLTLRRVLNSPGDASVCKYDVHRNLQEEKLRSGEVHQSITDSSNDAVSQSDAAYDRAREAVVKQWGAVPYRHHFFHGKRGDRAVFIALPGESVDVQRIKQILSVAMESKFFSLEILAWNWIDDWDWSTLFRRAKRIKIRLVQARSRVIGLADFERMPVQFVERFRPVITYDFEQSTSFSVRLEACTWNPSSCGDPQFSSLPWHERIDSWVVMIHEDCRWRVVWDSHRRSKIDELATESSRILFEKDFDRSSSLRIRITDILGITVSEQRTFPNIVSKQGKSDSQSKKSEQEKRSRMSVDAKSV